MTFALLNVGSSKMKVLILAAGYGTRLARDIKESGNYEELQGVPKPLLVVAGKPLISHWMDILATCPQTNGDVYVVVNDANRELFEEWALKYPSVQLVSSGSRTNEDRPGAVACIAIAVRHFNIRDHLLVIGGDTLFYDDFSLSDCLTAFFQSPAISTGGGFIPYYTCPDQDTSNRGILEVDETGKVVNFLEKPKPSETTSRRASPCFYVYSQNTLPLLDEFLEEKKDRPLKERDATGHFVNYLYQRRPVYTYKISGRYDIGGLEAYLQCCKDYPSSA